MKKLLLFLTAVVLCTTDLFSYSIGVNTSPTQIQIYQKSAGSSLFDVRVYATYNNGTKSCYILRLSSGVTMTSSTRIAGSHNFQIEDNTGSDYFLNDVSNAIYIEPGYYAYSYKYCGGYCYWGYLTGTLSFTWKSINESGKPVYTIALSNGAGVYSGNMIEGFNWSMDLPLYAYDYNGAPMTLTDYYTVSVSSSDNTYGTVSGGGTYATGAERTLTASVTDANLYEFKGWKKNGSSDYVSASANYGITVNGNDTYVAEFAPKAGNQQYTINTAVNNPSLGSVTAGGLKSENSNFIITATANDPNEYYVEDWLKNGDSMGVKTNPLVVSVTEAEDNKTYTAVFAPRTKKTLFCDDDMTFAGNGPYTFSGTAKDEQNNVYTISLSTTNVSQGNFSVQEKTNAINSITSKSGIVTTLQLSSTYYAVNAVVIGNDEVRYDISGGFQLTITSSFRSFSYNYSQDHILTEIEDVSEDWHPANKKFVTVTAYNMDNIDNATYNYLKLRFNTENLNYTYANDQIGPAPGTYPTITLGWWADGVGYCNSTEGIMSYRSDLRWLSSYAGDYQSAFIVGTYDVKGYYNMGSVVAEVSEGKDGKMFIMVKSGEQVWFTIGEPAGPPTLVLGETTNGTFSATDGTKNYTTGKYKMPVGAQLTLTATPAEGYVVDKWLFNGDEVEDELGNLLKSNELAYTVASEDAVDGTITIVPVFGQKSDCTMAFDNIVVEINEQDNSARLIATNGVGGAAVLAFTDLESFDEQTGVPAGTYTIGTNLTVGNAATSTGSYVTDGSSIWDLASGTVTIAKANGKMTLTTSSVKSTDPLDVSLTATNITCSIVRRITYIINNALYSDNNEGRFRFIGTTVDNKEISICFYGNELNPVGTYTNDDIYDGDYPNNYVTIANVHCTNVQYATVTKEGYYYILDAEFDNPNGGYYHVIMKALVPITSDDTMEDYLVTRNDPSSYVTFDESDITVTQQAEGYQYLHAKTGGSNYMEAKMYFYTGSAEAGIPTGTYTISDSQQPGTVRMINSTAYRSYTNSKWYIAQGTVTVVHQNNHYYIVVRAFNTRYKANDNRLYTVNFTIGTEITTQTYTLTLNAGAHGTVTVYNDTKEEEVTFTNNEAEIEEEDEITINYSPAPGYYVGSFNDSEDNLMPSGYSFTMEVPRTITVTFEPNVYDITYKDQGNEIYSGDNESNLPASHTYNAPTALVDGVKEGYTFNGWYENAECTGEAVNTIAANSITADKTLYAKWTAYKTLRVNDAEHGTVSVTNAGDATAGTGYKTYSVAVGTEVTLSAAVNTANAVDKYFYEFKNWNVSAGGVTVSENKFIMPDADVTLEAQFGIAGTIVLKDGETDFYGAYQELVGTLNGTPVNVHLNRNGGLKAGAWSTICLPFDCDIEDNILEGKIWNYQGATGDWEQGLDLHFAKTGYMEANTPYLYYNTTAVSAENLLFNNVVLTDEDPKNIHGGSVTFKGVLARTQMNAENRSVLFLQNNKIYYLGSSGATLRAYRAYFETDAPAGIQPRVRIMLHGDNATDMEVLEMDGGTQTRSNAEVRKYMENGVLIIERGGVRYDATGAKIN